MSASSVQIPARTNIALTVGMVALCGLFYLVLPTTLLRESRWFGLLLVAFTLTSNTYWAIIHEAIHGKIHPSKRVNNLMGRVLCVFFGSPFQVLRFGHLMHHRFNRSPIDRTEVYAAPEGPSAFARRMYYFKLLGGLYLMELFASVLAMFPKRYFAGFVMWVFGEVAEDGRTMKVAAEGQLLMRPGYTRAQIDGLLATALFGLSFWAYGENWWMLALALFGRAFLISFFDNAYHYGNQLDDALAGYNLHLPKALEVFVLNFNMHATHHRYPRSPWTAMPGAFQADREVYHHPYLAAAGRQLKGMIGVGELPSGPQGPGRAKA